MERLLSVINERSINVRFDSQVDLTKIYTQEEYFKGFFFYISTYIKDYHSNVQNVYTDDNENLLVASSSIPFISVDIDDFDLIINGTFLVEQR